MKRLTVLGAALLAACAQAPTQPGASLSGATPTAQPGRPASVLIVVAEMGASRPTVIRLLREDGSETTHLVLKTGDFGIAAAGSRVFFRSGNYLKAVHADGSIEDLQLLPDAGTEVRPSPDGKRWLWVKVSQLTNGYESKAYVGTVGEAPREIATLQDSANWLLPVRWSPEGAFLQRMGGIDGYFVFGLPIFPPVQRFDPIAGGPTTVPSPQGCSFADQAHDGTLAWVCSRNPPTLRFGMPGGHPTTLSLSTPRFNYLGDIYFSPDGKRLTVAGAAGVGGTMGNPNPQPEQFGTDLIGVGDGSIVRFGPAGVKPAMNWQSWLPDGRLVLWRPWGAAGGPSGLYILDPGGSGQGPETLTGGIPLGYLTP